MALSLRTRLTAWYSVLLVLTVAVFSAAVLWLHWRLLLEQFDEGLTSISATATRRSTFLLYFSNRLINANT